MRKRWAYVILLLGLISLGGCAFGDAWYYPYGPCYFGKDGESPKTVNEFLSQQRPE